VRLRPQTGVPRLASRHPDDPFRAESEASGRHGFATHSSSGSASHEGWERAEIVIHVASWTPQSPSAIAREPTDGRHASPSLAAGVTSGRNQLARRLPARDGVVFSDSATVTSRGREKAAAPAPKSKRRSAAATPKVSARVTRKVSSAVTRKRDQSPAESSHPSKSQLRARAGSAATTRTRPPSEPRQPSRQLQRVAPASHRSRSAK
jgi:hypothetical protein